MGITLNCDWFEPFDSANLEAMEQESFEPAGGNGSFQQIRPQAEKSRYCKNWANSSQHRINGKTLDQTN